MVTPLEVCIADEVLAIVAAKHLRHNEIQTATGINERTWRRYFVEHSRAIPAVVLIEVGDAIGVPAEQVIAAARARLAELEGDPEAIAAHALAQLSPEAQAEIAKVAESLRPRGPSSAPKRAAGQ